MALANDLLDVADVLPRGLNTISSQLRRAAVSIPANISEGNARFHKADRKHFFNISRGSTFECATLVDLCLLRKAIQVEEARSLKERLEEISKMLFVLARNTGVKRKLG